MSLGSWKLRATALEAAPGWSANLVWAEPGDAAQSVGNPSRAYRVNLTVLALVALFTGAYLVFSVLAESLLLGLVGSAASIALGTALAAATLSLLGGDLGGGYFAGAEPVLQWSLNAALLYGALGVGAALLGGWWPARSAQGLAPAQALKGLGQTDSGTPSGRIAIVLIAAGALLTLAPAVFGIPLAAYVAIALLPWGVALLLR